MKSLLAAITALAMLVSMPSAFAQGEASDQCENSAEVQSALSFYDNNDYGRASTSFEPLAIAGNPCAQYWLAEMYHNGQGVPRDQSKYIDWLKKSAAQGYTKARVRLTVISQ
ncbi:tetratricopeptide repeat protein [Caballeronia sp.]|uniref:tetratricopeptide repeat protein n=1 Tax=Caballeronia sp. TaxID=1931223 RepID=UPI003C39CC57